MNYYEVKAISNTLMGSFKRSPAHFKFEWENLQEDVKSKKAFLIGSALHTLVLEPKTFDNNYAIAPKSLDFRTKEGSEWTKKHLGKTWIKYEDYKNILGMASAINSNPFFNSLKENAFTLDVETPIFWKDKITGLSCKAKPDIVINKEIIVDIKTTFNASPADFCSTFFIHDYHRQAAWYMDAIGAKEFYFVCVEKEPPYNIAIFAVSENTLENGRTEYQQILSELKERFDKDIFPGYQNTYGNLPYFHI